MVVEYPEYPDGSRNSDPQFMCLPCWDSKALRSFLLKASMMLPLCTATSFVHLKDNTGGRNYFDVVLMSYFTVVAIHNVFDSCWKYRLPFSGFSISYPLYTAYL